MNSTPHRLPNGVILLIVLLLPAYVNPFAIYPYETSKTVLYWAIISIATLVFLFQRLHSLLRNRQAGVNLKSLIQQSISQNDPLFLPVISYGIVYLLATVFSINPAMSFWGLGDLRGTLTIGLVLTLFFLARYAIRTWSELENLFNAVIMGSIPVSIYGWVQLFGLDLLHQQYQPNHVIFIHSTFGSHGYLGTYLAMVVPVTFFQWIRYRRDRPKQSFGYATILLLQLSCLILAFSRSAFIGLAVGGLVFVGLRIRKSKLFRRLTVISLFLAGGLIFYIVLTLLTPVLFRETGYLRPTINLRFVRLFSDRSRIQTWGKALQLIPHRLILGYGPETFSIADLPQNLAADGEREPRFPYDPHNLILFHLTALGLTGLAAFIWVVIPFYQFSISWLNNNAIPKEKSFLYPIVVSITVYLIQAQFFPDNIITLVLFWLFLGCGAVAHSLLLKSCKNNLMPDLNNPSRVIY